MKVRVTYRTPQMAVDEVFSGATADEIVAAMQKAVAAKLNFLMRSVVSAMSPTQFAQEVVSRYNSATGKSLSLPRTPREFLALAQEEGIVTVLEA